MKNTIKLMMAAIVMIAILCTMTSCFGWLNNTGNSNSGGNGSADNAGDNLPDAHVHTASDSITVITAPTCTTDGSGVYVCTTCGENLSTENIPATGHNETTVTGTAATCIATGLTDGKVCADCGAVIVAQETIPVSTIHNETTVTGTAATCVATGLTDGKVCADCGVVIVAQETIPVSTIHNETTVTGTAATCVATGLTDGKVCADCGAVIVAQEIIPVSDHVPGEPVVTPATAMMNGKSEVFCTVCNVLMSSNVIEATGSIGLDYELDVWGESYTVTGIGTCTDTELVIPNTYNGLPVTSIKNYAFNNNSTITAVVIGENINEIGMAAFVGCTNLVTAEFKSQFIKIGEAAFMNSGVVMLDLTSGTSVLSKAAFGNCINLSTVLVSSSTSFEGDAFMGSLNVNFTEYNNGLYLGNEGDDYIVLYSMIDKEADSIEIHENTTQIAAKAFDGCVNLTYVVIPDGVLALYDGTLKNFTRIALNSKTNLMSGVFGQTIVLEQIDYNGTSEQFAETNFMATEDYWAIIVNEGIVVNCNDGSFIVSLNDECAFVMSKL